ncbi:MAG: DUF7619 domain-containing protein [Flavobacterium sp.]
MKKLFASLFLFFCFMFTVESQVINFPDANFKAKLLAAGPLNTIAKNLSNNFFKIDSNSNGEIEISEALQVSYLDLSNSSIQNMSGILNFSFLKHFDCSNNQLTALNLSGLVNLELLNSAFNYQLTSLNLTGCNSIKFLTCRNNNIGILDVSSFSDLQTLDCAGSHLTSLNVSGLTNLSTLDACCNLLTTLSLSSCINLTNVICDNNQLTTLDVNGLSNLQILNLHNNNLTTLNLNGCVGLTELICWNNQITALDLNGMSDLVNLECWLNQLATLNLTGCVNLQNVDCHQNNLSSLDLSTLVSLEQINCRINNLISLDVNNLSALNFLDLSFNHLTSIDVSSCRLLDGIFLNDNNLTFVNLKNGIGLTTFSLGNNPNLTYVCCDDFEIAIVENSTEFNPNINSYCSFTPGGNYAVIEGNTKFDIQNNGCDNGDINYQNLRFSISNGTSTSYIISNTLGDYSLAVYQVAHTITPMLENASYFNIFPSSIQVSFPTQTSPVNQNFCITPNGIHKDLEVSIIPISVARPGFDATYKMIYKNKGTSALSGSVTFLFDENKIDYVSSSVGLTNQSLGLLSWDFNNLLPFQTREILVELNINSPTETPAVNIGDQLNFTTVINPLTDDEFLPDNTKSLKQIVVGSFDPNDKTCLEGNVVGPEMIGQYVHYVIRFENTGTFTAENIVVKDMIDLTKFDINSLVPINSSHSFITRIEDDKVEFIFENIQLPFDDANNDGYIAFKIKTKPTLLVGDTFTNNASIYFDYNYPIVTNTASTTIEALENQDFDFFNYFSLFPNPANEVLNIKAKETVTLKSIAIYNLLGQMVLVFPNANQVDRIDISNLKSGSYFIKLVTNEGTTSTKFVKN